MIFSLLLIITLAQLLASSNAAPQLLDEFQLCHEADGSVSETRWAEMFGILGIIGEEEDGISKYFFVINEYEGHYLVRQNGCFQQVEEASDLMDRETLCVDTTGYAILGGLDTSMAIFKEYAMRLQQGINRNNGTMTLMIPTVTGDKTFTVVVETSGTQSTPLQIDNAYWLCEVSQANPNYSECLWRPRRDAGDWKITPYAWDRELIAVADEGMVNEDMVEEDMDSSDTEVDIDIDAEDLEGVPTIG